MTNEELMIQTVISAVKNIERKVDSIHKFVSAPTVTPVIDSGPVLNAIKSISLAAPEVDFTPILEAIKAIPAPDYPVPDFTQVMSALDIIGNNVEDIETKLDEVLTDDSESENK